MTQKKAEITRRSTTVRGGYLLLASAAVLAMTLAAAQDVAPVRTPPKTLFSAPLADAPGKSLVVVELNYMPNSAPPSTPDHHRPGHRHPGSVYVYVTQGAVRLGLEGQPVRIVKAGEGFFEPVGAHHIVNENASATDAARAIAVMIVPEGQALTTRDEE